MRKLQQQLAEQREELNDSYYEHSVDSQQEALDKEAQAYEEAMNRFVEGLRDSLDLTLEDMDGFIEGVTAAVTANAPLILDEYGKLKTALDNAIVAPWQAAEDAMDGYTKEDGLGLMNSWTAEGGVFDTFATDATEYLTSIWSDTNVDPDDAFSNAIIGKVEKIKDDIKTNVDIAKGYLTDLYDVKDTSIESPSDDNGDNGFKNQATDANVRALQQFLNQYWRANIDVDGSYGPATKNAVKNMQKAIGVSADGFYGASTVSALQQYYERLINQLKAQGSGSSMIGQGVQEYNKRLKAVPVACYAKGTMRLEQDQFAITDESWIGEEITLAAGKNGQLQYLKKGSAVMPASISETLVEWGHINPSDMMANMAIKPIINNIATNKNNVVQISVDSLIKADNITNDMLPELSRAMDKKLDEFAKKLNYSLKRYT